MRIFSIKEKGIYEDFSQTNFHVDHEGSALEIGLKVKQGSGLTKVFTTNNMANCREKLL